MDAKLHDFVMTRDGAAILSLRIPAWQGAAALYDELKDTDVSVEIKKKGTRRSLTANAYAWVLIDKIAEKTGVPVADVYRNAVRNVGGNTTRVCVQDEALQSLQEAWAKNGMGWVSDTMESKIDGCTVVILYTGSSCFTVKQMARMIDALVQDAQALDIETMPPYKLASLLEGWEKKNG